jgi:hypothetical protein
MVNQGVSEQDSVDKLTKLLDQFLGEEDTSHRDGGIRGFRSSILPLRFRTLLLKQPGHRVTR